MLLKVQTQELLQLKITAPDYPDIFRHWHPGSEAYAGGDALITALDDGWVISGTVRCEEVWHTGNRRMHVYHVPLVKDTQTMYMPVIGNPYVERLLREIPIQVVRMNQRKGWER